MRVRLTARSIAAAGLLALSGGLLLWLALSGVPAQAQSAEPAYVDVPGDAWYYEPVTSLKERGIFEGTDCEEGFCPGKPLKRWQMAVWLVRLLDGQDPASIEESRFEDVGDYGDWVHFIDRLAQLEVTGGCKTEPLSYCPERSVTRSQMAAFLYQAFDLPDAEGPAGFVDVSEKSWAFGYINALAASKITSGCKSEPFSYCPERPVTKAQMAAFLYVASERQQKLAEEALSNPNNIPDYDPDVFYTERNRVSVLIKQEIIDKFADDNRWLLRAWNHTNRPDFEYVINDTQFKHVQPAVIYSRHSGEELNKIKITRFSVRTRHLEVSGTWRGFVHELAHVYTLANGVSVRPEALAAAHLYFADLSNGDRGCPSHELYADAAQLLVPLEDNTYAPYWHDCEHLPSVATSEAETVVRSAFSDEIPQWFHDTFQRDDSSWDYKAVWDLVKSLDHTYRVTVVYQLKDAFGGYCSDEDARSSAFYGLELDQPWRDGGCPDN